MATKYTLATISSSIKTSEGILYIVCESLRRTIYAVSTYHIVSKRRENKDFIAQFLELFSYWMKYSIARRSK